MASDVMKTIEARLRADAPAWREAVAQGAGTMGAEAHRRGARRRGLAIAAAASITGVALGVGLWAERSSIAPPENEVRVVVPAVPTLDELAVTRWEEPYRAEVERVTEDVRRAVRFVVEVLPDELVEPVVEDDVTL